MLWRKVSEADNTDNDKVPNRLRSKMSRRMVYILWGVGFIILAGTQVAEFQYARSTKPAVPVAKTPQTESSQTKQTTVTASPPPTAAASASPPAAQTKKSCDASCQKDLALAQQYSSQAAEIRRCLNIDNPAYIDLKYAIDSSRAEVEYRTKDVFKDPRLSSAQMQAIVRYNDEKANKTVDNAYSVYLGKVQGSGCKPTYPNAPAHYEFNPAYPDLMLNFPYLADYPNVS